MRVDDVLLVLRPPEYTPVVERVVLEGVVERVVLTVLLVVRVDDVLLVLRPPELTLVVERVVLEGVVERVAVVAVALVERVVLAGVVERVVLPNVLPRVALVVAPVARVDELRSAPVTLASRARTPLLELRISRALVIPVFRCVNERSG